MDDFRQIPLTQGKFAVVDAADYDWLNQWKWCAQKTDYGWRAARYDSGDYVYMHRLIMGAPGNRQVDHRDGDGLNNRRSNLRLATSQQNLFNRGPNRNNSSGHKGVKWRPHAKKWQAYITVNRKQIHLGYFTNIDDAAAAYTGAAKDFAGEFARSSAFAGRSV